jgi:predicted permease
MRTDGTQRRDPQRLEHQRRDRRRGEPAQALSAGPAEILQAVLSFVLEVAALGAFWYIGSTLFRGAGGMTSGLVVAAAVAVGWGLFMAPKARRRVPWPWHPLVALAVFAAAGLGAAAAGQPLGLVLAAVALGNTVLTFWLRRKY